MASDDNQRKVFRSGFLTLVGRPNAGKSTLLNVLMGEKIAITSSTSQTTRHRFSAVCDDDDSQIVIVDTPGLHKPTDALGEELNKSAMKALEDVDVVAMLVDGTQPVGLGDAWVAEHLKKVRGHKILVITKADLMDQNRAEKQIARLEGVCRFDDIIVISARKDFNIDAFKQLVISALPAGPHWFPQGMKTDQPIGVMVSEFIREKILRETHDEVPHSVGVLVDDMWYEKKKNLSHIDATIYVEHDSQKGIIIGKGGSMIKKIGTDSRVDLERLIGNPVYLDLKVKLKKDWRKDASQIRRFGYGEGA